METVIDTVRADVLEIGDVTYFGVVTELEDNGDYVIATIDNEDTVSFFFSDSVHLFGTVYDEGEIGI